MAAKKKITQRTLDAYEFAKCQQDVVYFVDTYVKIRHSVQGVIPFKLWPWQAALLDLINKEQKIVVLKSRQLGVSELAVCYALWLVRFHPSKTAIFISKNKEDAKDLLKRLRLSYSHLPEFLQGGEGSISPTEIGDDNTERMTYIHYDAEKHPHPSEVRSLAATENAGRSASASFLVLDEWAHQQYAEEILTASQPTTDTGGKILGISTANGVGNTFHEIYTKAVAKENSFRGVFLPWSKHPDRDQAWYERTLRDMNQPWKMHQEHPTTATEAFVQSGRPVFNQEVLSLHEQRMATSVRQVPLPDMPVWMEDGLTLWAYPQPDWQYNIGADVAEGLEWGDWSVAAVYSKQTHEQVAELRGRWEPEIFAQKLDWLGHYFNRATLAVERNNHGHAVLLALTSPNMTRKPYPRVYRYRDPAKQRGERMDVRPGWPTTSITKPLILDMMAKDLREETLLPSSRIFLGEATIFAIQPNGSMCAPDGYNDDAVMAHAICNYTLNMPSSDGQGLIDAIDKRASKLIEREYDHITRYA